MKKSAAKKKKLDKAYDSCIEEINEVCNTYLNAQYKALCFHVLEKLKRKVDSPLLKWERSRVCLGTVTMVCLLNDLFDEDHEDHVSREELASRYSCSVIQASSFAIDLIDVLNVDFSKYEFVLPEYRLSREEYENQTNIFLLGMSNVGKTTTAKLAAAKLGYDFYDLDEEVKKFYAMTLDQFHAVYWLGNSNDVEKGKIIGEIVSKPGRKVIAVTPMYYSSCYTKYTRLPGAVPIVLEDTPEHIFDRLVFADENDVVYKDDDYKNEHRKHYLKEIGKDITYYKKSFAKVENHFNMNGESPEQVVERLIEEYHLNRTESEENMYETDESG